MHWHSHSSVDLTPLALGFVGGLAGALTYAGRSELQAGHDHPPQRTGGGQVSIVSPPAAEPKALEVRRCSQNVRKLLQVLRIHHKNNAELPRSLNKIAKDHRIMRIVRVFPVIVWVLRVRAWLLRLLNAAWRRR